MKDESKTNMQRDWTARDANRQKWRERMEGNQVLQTLSIVQELGTAIARGRVTRPRLLCGTSGVGKTRALAGALDHHRRSYRRIKSSTKLGLAQALHAAARNKQIALFDDNKTWDHPDMLQVLMAATAPPKEGPRIYTHIVNKKTVTYYFDNLTIVIITNTNVSDLSNFPKNAHPYIKALTSRVPPLILYPSDEEVYNYTCYLAINEDMLLREGYTLVEVNDALAFFGRNRYRLADVSPRSLLNIAAERRDFPKSWRAILEPTLSKEVHGTELAEDDIPQVVL
jgi:hypothetical protein